MKFHHNDKVIVLIGKTGVGKSTFIHDATGENPQSIKQKGLNPCTTHIEFVRTNPLKGDSSIVFMDTPGLDTSGDADEIILSEIADRLKKIHRDKINLAGILYLYRISDNRFNSSSIKTLQLLENMCGKEALSHVIVVTTMWSNPEELVELERERQLKKFCDQILGECHMQRFNNTPKGAWSIINAMLQKSHSPPLAIQTELAEGMKFHETKAAKHLRSSKQEVSGGLLNKLRKLFRRSRQ